ncbi:MAG: hypothetical protein ACRDBL_11515 [Rhabdaerophilum sp.]
MMVIRLAKVRGQATSFCTEWIRAEGFRMPPGCPTQDRMGLRRGLGMNQVLPMSRLLEFTPPPKLAKAVPRQRVISQLWRMAERQVNAVEQRLVTLGDEPQALEREAKTLGLIARTVRELIAIDEEKAKAKSGGKGDEDNQPAANRALDDFRRELAEKLEQLRSERAGSCTVGAALAQGD